MLKKPINSARFNLSSRKRILNHKCLPKKAARQSPAALRSLRLWIFFSTFTSYYSYFYATGEITKSHQKAPQDRSSEGPLTLGQDATTAKTLSSGIPPFARG